jgi:aspartyl-tRNA(Asn)/glutamyl-tRNA(Gln) amidotransferase subunit A
MTACARTEATLARIAAAAHLNAFVRVDADGAREGARRVDAGLSAGPLAGVAVAIKDNIAVRGLPRQAGTAAMGGAPSVADATVVARLRAAGAVVVGTLNMHEGALGATTDNPFWGRCANPAVPGATPGGSSGGSAAAVAAGLVPLALGTDTMGSVRIPAAYCGLWGLKPTRGLIPNTGLLHLSWTLDTIGPIAASAEGIAEALAVLAGEDAADPVSITAPQLPGVALHGATIAVPDDAILAGCEPAVRAAHEACVARAQAAGARIVPFAAGWEPGRLRRAGLLVCEVEGVVVLADAIAAEPEGFSAGFRALLDYGRRAPAPRLAEAYRLLAETGGRARRALRGVDALLLPTAPQRAFAHDAPVPADQADLTALANVAGLPALAFPLPAPDGGAPCSGQIIGPAFSEMRLIGLARALTEGTA